jgi:hypothetical protein
MQWYHHELPQAPRIRSVCSRTVSDDTEWRLTCEFITTPSLDDALVALRALLRNIGHHRQSFLLLPLAFDLGVLQVEFLTRHYCDALAILGTCDVASLILARSAVSPYSVGGGLIEPIRRNTSAQHSSDPPVKREHL